MPAPEQPDETPPSAPDHQEAHSQTPPAAPPTPPPPAHAYPEQQSTQDPFLLGYQNALSSVRVLQATQPLVQMGITQTLHHLTTGSPSPVQVAMQKASFTSGLFQAFTQTRATDSLIKSLNIGYTENLVRQVSAIGSGALAYNAFSSLAQGVAFSFDPKTIYPSFDIVSPAVSLLMENISKVAMPDLGSVFATPEGFASLLFASSSPPATARQDQSPAEPSSTLGNTPLVPATPDDLPLLVSKAQRLQLPGSTSNLLGKILDSIIAAPQELADLYSQEQTQRLLAHLFLYYCVLTGDPNFFFTLIGYRDALNALTKGK